MRKFLALVLCFLVPTVAFAAEPANVFKVKYDGGSLLGVKSGDEARLRIAEKEVQILGRRMKCW